MSNNLQSNTTEKLARKFLESFEASRCLTKCVDTQLIAGSFTPSSGGTVSVKRPHDYRAVRTARGDISAATKNSIISGKATATVQDYITVPIDWDDIEEALELDQLDQIIKPAAERAVTELEVGLAEYARKNLALSVGNPDNAVNTWAEVAQAGSLMDSLGVPMSEAYYLMNPYVARDLAGQQSGLNASDSLVKTAWEKAQISSPFGGLQAISCSTLQPMSDDAALADRVGAVNGAPVATYVSVKDTMIQTINVDGFTANATIKAGSVVEVTGVHYLNMKTRKPFIDNTGAFVKFRGTVVADTVLDGTGAGTLQIAGAAINEVDGQYNTVDAAIADNDVITVLGTAGYTAQPNLFFHKQALGMASIKLSKLYAQDTIITSEDGISIRVTRYSDGDTNVQKVRFDLLPAFVTYNPFFGGLGYGS